MKKSKYGLRFIFSSYLITLLVAMLIFAVSFPIVMLFSFFQSWVNNPYGLHEIFNLVTGLIILPFFQVFWFLFLISIVDNEKPFIKAFEENLDEFLTHIKLKVGK